MFALLFRIKSKDVTNQLICQKNKKVFLNYFDYYLKDLKYNDSNSNKLPDLVSDGQESTNTNVDDQMTILYTNVKKITDHLSQTAIESKHIEQTTKFINEKREKML